jgi:integrase
MGSITTLDRKTTGKKATLYRAYVRRSGVSKSKVFDTKTAARKWIADNENTAALAAAAASGKAGTLSALIESFVKAPPDKGTRYWAASHLDFWQSELGPVNVAELSRGAINAAKARLQSKRAAHHTYAGIAETPRTLSPATVNRYLASLSSVLNFAVKRGMIDHHPMKGGKVEKLTEGGGRRRVLNEDEEAAIMAAARRSTWAMLPLFVRMAFTTAARKSELLGLRWQDVHLHDSIALLTTTKNGQARALPLVADVRMSLIAAMKVKPLAGDFVFFDPKHPERPKNIDSVWQTCRKHAGLLNDRADPLDRVVLHSTRHTAVTKMLKGGANLAQAAAVSGHKTLAMLKRYEHLAAADSVALAQRLLAGK